jgi:EAL domain-containing protein (putative c-di-GMP-specific phosphodiesterase class I)
MGHLKRLPVSSLKIDRSFVSNMEADENDAVIVNTVTGLAHDFGMTVVAEGVENAETLLTLKVIRCNFAQGFHICRPLPAAEISAWLNR